MGKYKLGSLIFKVSVILFLILSHSSEASGPPGVSTETSDDWGVRTTTVNTPSGKLTINMPDDAALGDTISGTVVAEPAGETVAEKQSNMDTLEGYVVDIEEVPEKTVVGVPKEAPGKEPEGKKTNTWVIPPVIATEITSLVLKDPKGNEVAETDFPVTSPPAYTPPEVPGPEDYNLPTIGQAGRPVEMTGPFDGELVNTEVKIGGRQTDVLAQSPRKTVAQSPRDVVGPTNIELTDGDVTVTEPYRSVALKLSADKLRLKRGERTTLRVRVMGLQGLEEQIPFSLVNKSPAVVSMEGGNVQTVTVRPEEVGPEGDYTIEKTLTGVQTGPFSISARISPEYMTVPMPTLVSYKKDDKCECRDMKIELGKKSETRRFQEKLKDGSTRILVEIPYKFKTRCSKGDPTEKCDAEIKVGVLRKNWKGPEPASEEVHSGGAGKVTYYTKPPKGADKNIDCGRDCPKKLSWNDWVSGLLYYEALFKKLDKKIGGVSDDKLKITLTPEKCDKGREGNKVYNLYGCECNKVTLVFPGVKKSKGKYHLDVEGGISQRKPGVYLVIPYIYNTQCTGHAGAECNAVLEVQGKVKEWEVENVEKRKGGGFKATGDVINAANVTINNETIECTGKCDKRGKPGKWNPNDIKKLRMRIDVPVVKIPRGKIDRHNGEFELTFTPKFCDEVEIRDIAGKGGKVIKKITFKADIKSQKWKNVVGE